MTSKLQFVKNFGGLAAAVCMLSISAAAMAQLSYPARPVRIVVAAAAGGFVDVIARLVGQKLSERLGQPMVIENRGGAGGNIAAKFVGSADPDGYTLLATTAQISINPSLYKNPGYDLFGDFMLVALTGSTPGVFVVHPSNPANSLRELIAQAKGKRVSYATAGVGTSSHIAADYLLRALAGLDVVHIPYPGGAPAINAVVANQMEMVNASMPAMVGFIGQGRLKALAVSSLKRVDALPNVPTVTEAGFADFEERSWVGLFAPAKTSAAIVLRLNGEVNQILALADIKQRFVALGMDAQPGSVADFEAYVRKEVAKWARFVKSSGVTVD